MSPWGWGQTWQGDKCGIGWGRFVPMELTNYGSFDGAKFTLDEAGLDKEFRAISNAGANFVRIFPWGVWGNHPFGKRSQFQPYVLNTSKDLWNLSKFNSYYFPIMRRVFEIANGVNMSVMFDLFDNCQFHGDGIKQWSPWANNVQGILRPEEAVADRYTKAWIEKCLAEFKGYDVVWSLGNEMVYSGFPDFVARVVCPFIKAKKFNFKRLVVGADFSLTNSYQSDVLDAFINAHLPGYMAAIRPIHTCGGPCDPPDAQQPYGPTLTAALDVFKPACVVLVSDDAVYNGDSRCDFDDRLRYRPSPATWGMMVKYVIGRHPNAHFEHIPHGPDLACHVETFEAISQAYKDLFGQWPVNYGKYPPAPAPDPEHERRDRDRREKERRDRNKMEQIRLT